MDVFIDKRDDWGWIKNRNGKGVFGQFQPLPKVESKFSLHQPVIKDFDKDGDMDLLLTVSRSRDANSQFLFLQNLSDFNEFEIRKINQVYSEDAIVDRVLPQGHLRKYSSNTTIDRRNELFTMDMDNDQNPDVFYYDDKYVYWNELNLSEKNEYMQKKILIPFTNVNPPPVPVDFDLDGDMDLFFTSYSGGDYSQLAWIENINWGEQFRIHYIGLEEDPRTTIRGYRLLDVDNDGDQDIAGLLIGTLYVYVNKEGNFKFWSRKYPVEGHIIDVADMNKDGKMDIVIQDPKRIFYFQNAYSMVNMRFLKSLLRVIGYYPLVYGITFALLILILKNIFNDKFDDKSFVFPKLWPSILFNIVMLTICVLPLATAFYSNYWLILSVPFEIIFIASFFDNFLKSKETDKSKAVTEHVPNLSIIIFRQGANRPDNAIKYYQAIVNQYFTDYNIKIWRIVGIKNRKSIKDVEALYRDMTVKRELPILREPLKSVKGRGYDGSYYVALFFGKIKKIPDQTITKSSEVKPIESDKDNLPEALKTINWETDGNYIMKFPVANETQYKNHVRFIKTLKKKNLFLNLRVIGLVGTDSSEYKYLLILSGSMNEAKKFDKLYFDPKAEKIFYEIFGSDDQNWRSISPPSTSDNVAAARPGYSIDLTSYYTIVNHMKAGGYKVSEEI